MKKNNCFILTCSLAIAFGGYAYTLGGKAPSPIENYSSPLCGLISRGDFETCERMLDYLEAKGEQLKPGRVRVKLSNIITRVAHLPDDPEHVRRRAWSLGLDDGVAQSPFFRMFCLLLDKGADLCGLDADGKLLIERAICSDLPSYTQVLLEAHEVRREYPNDDPEAFYLYLVHAAVVNLCETTSVVQYLREVGIKGKISSRSWKEAKVKTLQAQQEAIESFCAMNCKVVFVSGRIVSQASERDRQRKRELSELCARKHAILFGEGE